VCVFTAARVSEYTQIELYFLLVDIKHLFIDVNVEKNINEKQKMKYFFEMLLISDFTHSFPKPDSLLF